MWRSFLTANLSITFSLKFDSEVKIFFSLKAPIKLHKIVFYKLFHNFYPLFQYWVELQIKVSKLSFIEFKNDNHFYTSANIRITNRRSAVRDLAVTKSRTMSASDRKPNLVKVRVWIYLQRNVLPDMVSFVVATNY